MLTLAKKRLDELLVQRGLFPTRSRAQAAILAGQVLVNGQAAPKAGTGVAEDADIALAEVCKYVGRGGLKLEEGLRAFKVEPKGRTCVDVGASTGAFTDCLLQQGARKVYAVDVGRGQLDDKIRKDPRVVVMEKVNARYLTPSLFPETPDLAVVDVSFISLTKILPALMEVLKRPFDIVALIKPQFELSAREVPKGVVKDEAARQKAVDGLLAFAKTLGLESSGVVASPITGAKGNVEYLWRLSDKRA